MRNITLILLLVFCWGFSASASDLNSLEKLVGQWVGLRREISEEQRAWKRKESQWQQEIVLLEEESRRLDEMIWREKKLSSDKEGVTADQLARRDELTKVVADVGLVADRTAARLSEIVRFIPESLQSENILRGCRQLFGKGELLPPTRRLQHLVAALSEIESIQHRSHVVRELITLDGASRREMDVVYLGLACGFAVSPDSSIAAIGYPAKTGWQWKADVGLTAEIRKLVGIKQKKLPPSIVNLPISGNIGEVKL